MKEKLEQQKYIEQLAEKLAKIFISQINTKYFEKNKNKKKSKKDISF